MESVITIMVLLMMLGLYFLLLSDYKKTNERIDDYNKSLFKLTNVLREITIENNKTKHEKAQAEATVTTVDDTEVNNDIYNKIMTEWLGVNPTEEGDVNGRAEDDNNISSNY